MSQELPKTYSQKDVEKKWYDKWEQGKYFKPKAGKKNETFCVIMPPPNVTGILHMGHALDVTTQDVLTRYKRMKGFESLWLPGMDHAGISTQSVVEKKLASEGTSSREIGREKFLEETWKWKEHHGGVIADQQRALGASCDWDYSMFTMDPEANEAVNKVFVDMYNEGLIYQSDYIVNWDPKLQTAVSDAEVDHIEMKTFFYHIHYKVKDSDVLLEVATTRPETLLGDTAVAVNPNDDRFKHLIGKTAIVPICNREVPIVGDDYVDVEKGTGCLKVTPGHDFNDFEIGKRHSLEIINILNKDGTLNDYGLDFKGLTCAKARDRVIEKLEELGLFVKKEKHVNQVGHGERSKVVIEPMVSKQWFAKTADMSAAAVREVETDSTKFFPKGWENTYFSWLRNPRDWCISRQLWWGHQIPVFYCGDCNHQWAAEKVPTSCAKCLSEKITQDPDVLDTWFSSGLWPFSTLGWPNEERMKERGFDKFYPGSVLITGFDIIFFWVARMMMMGLKHTGKKPFADVYIHAIVRDKQGRKMSKSLGNGIDPLEVCEQYGADAMRFTLAVGSGYNRTLNLDPARIEGYRNFINKLWNAFRFIHPFLEDANDSEEVLPSKLTHQDRWILAELNTVSAEMNKSLDVYRFDDACAAIYKFTYDCFCSWYIEFSKPVLYGDDTVAKKHRATVLKYVLKRMLALLHPVAPYITEEIWGYVKSRDEDLLIVADYPEFQENFVFEKDQSQMNLFIDTISQVRNLRQSVNIPPKEMLEVKIFTDSAEYADYLNENKDFFKSLSNTTIANVAEKSASKPAKSIMNAISVAEIFLPLEGVIDLDEQICRLKKEIAKVEKEYLKFSKKLGNEKFVSNAKPEIIKETKIKAASFKEQLDSLNENLAGFQG